MFKNNKSVTADANRPDKETEIMLLMNIPKYLIKYCCKYLIPIIPLLILSIKGAHAVDGDVDLSFNDDGLVITAVTPLADRGVDITLQSDEKILMLGTSSDQSSFTHLSLVRYNPNGDIDTSFNSTGKITTNIGKVDWVSEVTTQKDGKILVAGTTFAVASTTGWDFFLVRYNIDGSLDTTFDSDGIVITSISMENDSGNAMALQNNGKILVAGSTTDIDGFDRFSLVRYNSDGNLDNSFSGDGILTTNIDIGGEGIRDIAIQPDGKILVTGYSNNIVALVRYHTNGNIDNSFGQNGIVTTPVGAFGVSAYKITIQPDAKILIAGNGFNGADMDFMVIRYNSDGSLDDNFANAGISFFAPDNLFQNYDEFIVDMILQPDGKILLAGVVNKTNTRSSILVRLMNNGQVDSSFANNGVAYVPIGSANCLGGGANIGTGINAIAQQSNGSILSAGTVMVGCDLDFAIARNLSTIVKNTPITQNNGEDDSSGMLNTYFLMLIILCALVRIKSR